MSFDMALLILVGYILCHYITITSGELNISFNVDFWHSNIKQSLKMRQFHYRDEYPSLSPVISEKHCTEVYLFCRNYRIEAVDCGKILDRFLQEYNKEYHLIANRVSSPDVINKWQEETRECLELQLWAHQCAYIDHIVVELTRLHNYHTSYENMLPSNPNYIVEALHPTAKVKTYLVAHEQVEGAAADENYRYRNPWAELLRISSTKFFESIIFADQLPERQMEWENADFVVISTYKSANLSHFDVKELRRLVDIAIEDGYEVIPLFRGYRQLIPGAVSLHNQGFENAWEALLLAMGYSFDTIKKFETVYSFYRNSYLIRPAVLSKLIIFMKEAINVAKYDSHVNQLLAVNSEYFGKFEVATRIFQTYYFQLHPFIFERLPVFFMHANEVKLCHGVDGKCELNFPN